MLISQNFIFIIGAIMANRINWRAFGPGILIASAAIGGSHLVASTQAGALYGWQLAIIILLANFFKYPFFRFATDYAYETGDSLITGYAKKSKFYLWVFFILSILSGMISTGAVALLTAVILSYMLPFELSTIALSGLVMVTSWALLIFGHFRVLDNVTKWIIILLTVTTVLAVMVAGAKASPPAPDFVAVSPFNMAGLAFIIALMGWMPTPLEFSVISSIWTAKKIRDDHPTHKQGLLDFNVGYLTSTILALFFLALGVFVQYGTGQEIAMQGGAYIGQLIDMYTNTIGEWARVLVTFIAFLCMFGTIITCVDGYGRANAECFTLISGHKSSGKTTLFWTTVTTITGFGLITFFMGQMATLLKFAMISAFVTAPIFAYLNYSLIKSRGKKLSPLMNVYAICGIVFLTGFTGLFLLQFFGVIG